MICMIKHDPLDELMDLTDLFRMPAGAWAGIERDHVFHVDIQDEPGEYILSAELPGIPEEKISIQFSDGILTIAADSGDDRNTLDSIWLCNERAKGQMSRSFQAEGIREDAIAASMSRGILTVHLPKSQEESAEGPRKIAITHAGE